jgi:uncharacterized protein (TIGR03083 family)
MDNREYLDALARDGAAFADACAAAGPLAPVPPCPGWTVADLTWHLLEVHHFWRTIVAGGRDTWEGYEQPARPAAGELVPAYRAGLDETLRVLSAADPAQANWTWAADHSAGWVVRRMAQETAVHCWDAQASAGAPAPVEPALASDGVDEFLQHFLDWDPDAPARVGGSVHLHCTDVAGEWTVREGDGAFLVTREHAKGDAALRGPAGNLLLALWRRVPVTVLDVVGDAEVAARFLAYSRLE